MLPVLTLINSSNSYNHTRFNSEVITRWDTKNLKTMYHTFFNAYNALASNHTPAFNQDIGRWNVSQVTNMEHIFGYAIGFNQNLSCWDLQNNTSSTLFVNDKFSKNNSSMRIKNYCILRENKNNQDIGLDTKTCCTGSQSGSLCSASEYSTYGKVCRDSKWHEVMDKCLEFPDKTESDDLTCTELCQCCESNSAEE